MSLLDNPLPEKNITRISDFFYYFWIQEKEEKLNYAFLVKKFIDSESVLVEFVLIKDNEFKQTLTGTGHAKAIYPTVLNMVLNYVNKYKPPEFAFNGEKTHKKFYNFYSNAIAKFFPDYNLNHYNDLNLHVFSRKDLTTPGKITKTLDEVGETIVDFLFKK